MTEALHDDNDFMLSWRIRYEIAIQRLSVKEDFTDTLADPVRIIYNYLVQPITVSPMITIGKNCVGEIKEGFDFISEAKTPAEVLNKREKASFVEDESRIFEEKVLLYRKRVTIDNAALAANDDYPMRGINEIMRLHLNRLTHKMDNPEVPIDSIDGNGNIQLHKVEKIYYVNIVFQLQYDEVAEYHHFRISMSRNGVIDIIQI